MTSGSYNVISEDGRAAPVQGAEVTASTFAILRVPPLLGRTLIPADEVIGAPNVVVIGYDLWQARLAGDPDVVGRSIQIGRVQHTVVGVMPNAFLFPYREHLWLPPRLPVLANEARGRLLGVFGRLSDGVSPEEAQAEAPPSEETPKAEAAAPAPEEAATEVATEAPPEEETPQEKSATPSE